jgi:Flp pilus assembly protein TadG
MFRRPRSRRARLGAIVVLAAFLIVGMLGMIAFAVDVGVMLLLKTQLQVAADSAAMAAASVLGSQSSDPITTAQQFASYHEAGGKTIGLTNADIEYGAWDSNAKSFTPSGSISNAVRVTARCNAATGGNKLFFGPIFGVDETTVVAQAVAMGNPRDICFVVDLSGSMNDDCEPCWSTKAISDQLGPQGYPTVAADMMQDVYDDFGYGTFPGVLQHVGQPLGVTQDSRAYARLTSNTGPLASASIPSSYRISSGNSESTRKQKAYQWMIDYQIATIMPNALPAPNSSTNYGYWEKYLDYVVFAQTVNSGAGTPPSNRGKIPPNQTAYQLNDLNNPNGDSYPDAGVSERDSYKNKIGYRTYVQFMMDYGRNRKPDGVNFTPLSSSSPNCPFHDEATAGGIFSFPPREQPTHSSRRSLIAALQKVKDRNSTISDSNQKDWVSIVTFDTVSGTVLRHALASNYDTAMQSCTTLQAVCDDQSSTATETGLIFANNHIKPNTQGGSGRIYTQKVVVLLTDGMANLKSSSDGQVGAYRNANPNSDWYGGGSYVADAALMQASSMELGHWKVFSVGIGAGTDFGFMDRIARMGGTANDNGEAPHTTGNPISYETEMSNIFHNIITNPAVRLVQ